MLNFYHFPHFPSFISFITNLCFDYITINFIFTCILATIFFNFRLKKGTAIKCFFFFMAVPFFLFLISVSYFSILVSMPFARINFYTTGTQLTYTVPAEVLVAAPAEVLAATPAVVPAAALAAVPAVVPAVGYSSCHLFHQMPLVSLHLPHNCILDK